MSTTKPASPKAPATKGPALLLVAHGVRGGPGIARDHATALSRLRLFDEVAVACLKGEPGVAAALAQMRARDVLVAPLLMAEGHGYRALLTGLPRRENTDRCLVLCRPLGVHPGLADIAMAMARKACAAAGWTPREAALLLAGHGTGRAPESRDSAFALARRLRNADVFADAEAAFLEDAPSVPQALAALGERRAVVLGFFADRGLHGEADIPRLIAASGAEAVYAGPIGAAPGIPTLLADLAPAEPQPIPFLHPAA
jgi:sirohydrochlorin ferrochelatase